MNKRRSHSSEFKARVAMEAISGRERLQEIVPGNAVSTIHRASRRRICWRPVVAWASGAYASH
ncbi:hypothetical protein Cyagr_0146 [Cyanobium gracile PCC 6307]|uniref:Transposase n=1 Tax=Cyanobium gracile (strain ATCC 27147 / PCC 6307) TaxID=292564 RepID=K9P1Z8_CYAGP|nr:hypothetical protein Cyagr_0146 [Cyanobium gracile PCC 6307]